MPDFSSQFDRIHGDDDSKAKDKLRKQLKGNFPKDAYAFLDDPGVRVEKTKIKPSDIDWQHRDEWAATHQPKQVKQVRKAIEHGHEKPIVGVLRPGEDNIMIADGHHHGEAYTQLGVKKMPAYVIKVNRRTGPWDEMHDKQKRRDG